MENSQLTIHISRTSVHVAEVLHSNRKVIPLKSIELHENNVQGYKDKLKELFEELNLTKQYDEYTVAWSTSKAELVPLSLFNESSSQAVFQFMFGDDIEASTIDYNRMMEISLVNVYEIPDWVKSFFIMKFPRISITHEHSMLLRALFQLSTFKRKAILNFNDEYLSIDVIEKNELVFSNIFEYQTEEDALYYLMYVLEQEKMLEEEIEVEFYYVGERNKEKASKTKEKMKTIRPLANAQLGEVETILKLHTLCV